MVGMESPAVAGEEGDCGGAGSGGACSGRGDYVASAVY